MKILKKIELFLYQKKQQYILQKRVKNFKRKVKKTDKLKERMRKMLI